ncbi:NRT2 ribosyltransferase, partial [Origma solitaria]|nr:NRT2 ribosyltransferase [Origma solitaria]
WPVPSMAPLALLALTVVTVAIEEVPLDMAPASFDDQYQGCRDTMMAALPALSLSEFGQNPLLARGWEKARAEWEQRGSRVSPLSSPAQAITLMAYTMDDLHEEFNMAVRMAGHSPEEYWDKFHFKALHLLLTDALAALRAQQGQGRHCVYCGVRGVRFTARPGRRVHFGHFASASLCRGKARAFGSDTTFHVHTQYGADIHQFSCYRTEDEVLIPPFETFNVTSVTRRGDKVSIKLNSTGTHSNYTCEWMVTSWGQP